MAWDQSRDHPFPGADALPTELLQPVSCKVFVYFSTCQWVRLLLAKCLFISLSANGCVFFLESVCLLLYLPMGVSSSCKIFSLLLYLIMGASSSCKVFVYFSICRWACLLLAKCLFTSLSSNWCLFFFKSVYLLLFLPNGAYSSCKVFVYSSFFPIGACSSYKVFVYFSFFQLVLILLEKCVFPL